MKQLILPIISSIIVGSAVYGFTYENNPSVLIEKQNREKVVECMDSLGGFTGSTIELQKEIKKCGEIELMSITGTHSTGTTVLPSQITLKQIDDAYILTPLWLKVCKKQINSPLCKDRKLFDRLYHLTEERLPGKNFYPILLGITNAESSLGLNYSKDRIGGTCAGRNNWGGIKWKKTDEGKSVKDQSIPDQFGCYLYKFDSIEDYWISKVNTIRFGYPGCVDSSTPVRCLSFAYVGDRNVAESSWIKNVSIFLE